MISSGPQPVVKKRPYDAFVPGDVDTDDAIPGDYSPHVSGTADPYAPNRSREGGSSAPSPGAGANPGGAFSPTSHLAGDSGSALGADAFSPARSRSSIAEASASGANTLAFSPSAPNLGQPAAQPNLIRDVYAPQLQDVSQRLESAYSAPRPGMFRQVAGALLSRKNPAIGGLVSGETQRQRTIEPLQQEYGLVSSQIAAQRAANTADLNAANVKSEIQGRSDLANFHEGMLGVRQDPPAKTPQEQAMGDYQTRINPATGKNYTTAESYRQVMQDAQDAKPDPQDKGTLTDLDVGGVNHKVLVDTKKGKIISDLGQSKLPNASTNEGTWTLDEDKDGNPVLFNSKTGLTKAAPPGIAKTGTKAKADAATEKLIGPARDAQQYASDYLTNGRFTGAGDEALQEKFFELAKPTTGFRMTQPQIDMLQNSRSWMSGVEAHFRHATTGTWFNDQQRQQIVSTMKDLADAKMKGQGAGGYARPKPNVVVEQ